MLGPTAPPLRVQGTGKYVIEPRGTDTLRIGTSPSKAATAKVDQDFLALYAEYQAYLKDTSGQRAPASAFKPSNALAATTAGAAPAAPAEECGKAPPEGKASCYEKALDKVLAEPGTEAALSALERYTKDDPVALREAHPLVHHIGRRSFAFYKDARVAMPHCKETLRVA